jgi:hypothetical protein
MKRVYGDFGPLAVPASHSGIYSSRYLTNTTSFCFSL